MWLPSTDPGGFGLIESRRYRGQEGAAPDAPVHSHLGIAGVTGFLFQDLTANPLDYVEGGALNARRVEISEYLDATHPDLTSFYKQGGKLIVTVGTNDSLASPGAQLDYYQSVIDRMGRDAVDRFARLWVMPQGGHGLSGNAYNVNGLGQPERREPRLVAAGQLLGEIEPRGGGRLRGRRLERVEQRRPGGDHRVERGQHRLGIGGVGRRRRDLDQLGQELGDRGAHG